MNVLMGVPTMGVFVRNWRRKGTQIHIREDNNLSQLNASYPQRRKIMHGNSFSSTETTYAVQCYQEVAMKRNGSDVTLNYCNDMTTLKA